MQTQYKRCVCLKINIDWSLVREIARKAIYDYQLL